MQFVPIGYSSFLPQSKHLHVRLTGDSELAAGLDVSVVGIILLWIGNVSSFNNAPKRVTGCYKVCTMCMMDSKQI